MFTTAVSAVVVVLEHRRNWGFSSGLQTSPAWVIDSLTSGLFSLQYMGPPYRQARVGAFLVVVPPVKAM